MVDYTGIRLDCYFHIANISLEAQLVYNNFVTYMLLILYSKLLITSY